MKWIFSSVFVFVYLVENNKDSGLIYKKNQSRNEIGKNSKLIEENNLWNVVFVESFGKENLAGNYYYSKQTNKQTLFTISKPRR